MYKAGDFVISELALPGVYKIETTVFSDDRGKIWSGFTKELNNFFHLKNLKFVHTKYNSNKKNVLRGIHYDNISTKFVSCIAGKINQFVINVNENSNNFGEYIKVSLKCGDGVGILIPPGYGNAFVSCEDNSIYCYQLSYSGNYPDASEQNTIKYNDCRININWGVDAPILSKRDT